MIAQRFRSLGWVAGISTAATGLYLVSLQVAAERGKLENVEREILSAQRDMRQLQTEFGTRASMRQLEKWNGDVLALSAPKADQFVKDGVQLAALNRNALHEAPNAPPAVMQASYTPPPRAQSSQALAPARENAPATLRIATYEKPTVSPRVSRVAMIDPAVMTDITAAAQRERHNRP